MFGQVRPQGPLPECLPHEELYQGRGKLGDAMTPPRTLIRASHFVLAGFWALILRSAFLIPETTAFYPSLLVALVVVTVIRPTAGLLLLAVAVPLAFAVIQLAHVPVPVAQLVEALVLAFLAGSSLRALIRPSDEGAVRLALPALTLGALVLVGGVCSAIDQLGSVRQAAGSMWNYVRTDYLFAPSRILGFQSSLRWMEVLALTVAVERAFRSGPRSAPLILASWLAASAATAAQSAVQVVQDAVSRGGGVQEMVTIVKGTRISAVYPDLNAAGSLFAMLTVIAFVFAVARRRWVFAAVVPTLLLLALLATQSRAAVIAVVVLAGAGAMWWLWQRGWKPAAVLFGAVVVAAAVGVAVIKDQTHVSATAAASSRLEMSRIALKIAREHPAFGVGAGRFQSASRDFLTPAFVVSFPEAANGENAHNVFMQVLGELGVAGLIAFLWWLWSAVRRGEPPKSADRLALVAGIAAFLISGLLGHPLLIFEIAVAFGLVVGMAAGLAGDQPRRGRWAFALLLLAIASAPFRIMAAQAPPPPPVVGASEIQAPLDGQPYRAAERVSRWRLRPHPVGAVFPMRWDASRSQDCSVRVTIDGQPVDEVRLVADAWTPVRLAIPPKEGSTPPHVELTVSDAKCGLLVGKVEAWR